MSFYSVPACDMPKFLALPKQERDEIQKRLVLLAQIEAAPGASWLARARHVALTNIACRGASLRSLQRLRWQFAMHGWSGLVRQYRPRRIASASNAPKPWAKGAIESQFRTLMSGGL